VTSSPPRAGTQEAGYGAEGWSDEDDEDADAAVERSSEERLPEPGSEPAVPDRGPEDELSRSLRATTLGALDDRPGRRGSAAGSGGEMTLVAVGFGPTKRDAKHAASKRLLCQLFPAAPTPADALRCALRVKHAFALEKKAKRPPSLAESPQRGGQRAEKAPAEDAASSRSGLRGEEGAPPAGATQQQKRRRADAVVGERADGGRAKAPDSAPAAHCQVPPAEPRGEPRGDGEKRQAHVAAANRESKKRLA
jgi:hypothetical protein